MRLLLKTFIITILTIVTLNSVHAASWNETLQGDLSNNGLAPSALALELGINSVKGSFNGVAPERDYLAVMIPMDLQLSELLIGDGFIQNDARSFIGVQAGSTMTVSPTSGSANGLLGFAHVQPGLGIDILPDMGKTANFGAIGFTGPLAAGTYTFWIQDTSGNGSFSYDFILSAVPEPESNLLMLLGIGVLSVVAKRRRSQ